MSGSQLRSARIRAGWKQAELAERLRCNRVSISYWERDRREMSPPMEELVRRVFADEGIRIGAGAKQVQARRKSAKVA